MKIGILQTGHAPDALIETTGDYDVMFANLLAQNGVTFQGYAVVDGEFPANGAEDADGWLITGSRHGAYEDHNWIRPLEDLIRDIDAQKKPLIGVCFGHQIIAQALGGKVEKFDGGWAIGRVSYDQNGDTVTMNAWHQDQVVDRPDRARVLAGNAFCENGILAYDDHIWTVQPHPEYGADFIQGLIDHRGRGVVPDDVLDAAAADLHGPVSNPEIATFMKAFLTKERT
ncbi:type 1 glutamine amidotransferase [Aliisedimentitalea scapharcae]|uniref:Type 1 glutamine amidotransferase n=1 Tax=Aliisedimentitalea scapharcae TaxID=1524259 RepID=A0ABZ2XVN7_9RHOB